MRCQAGGLRARVCCVQVKALVEFLMENCRELFGEESAEPWCAAGEEWPAPVPRCRGKRREGALSEAGAWPARKLGILSGGAGQGVLSSEARLCRGLSLATASGGMKGWLCKMS